MYDLHRLRFLYKLSVVCVPEFGFTRVLGPILVFLSPVVSNSNCHNIISVLISARILLFVITVCRCHLIFFVLSLYDDEYTYVLVNIHSYRQTAVAAISAPPPPPTPWPSINTSSLCGV